MLDKQVNIYCFDTACFNTPEETEQYQKLVKYRRQKNTFYEICKAMKETHKPPRGYNGPPDDDSIDTAINDKYKEITKKRNLNSKVQEAKDAYIDLIKKNTQVRELNPLCLKESRIISVFESALTRQAGFQTNGLYTDMFVVEVFFYDIMTQLILNGCNYNGEHYIFRFSSAGQIRHKKIVMIKESLWNRIEPSLTCGLTEDMINAKGGVNINKYLVYIALSASSTDPVPWFDIDRSIVVDDFETTITGQPVDFIDDATYKITRTTEVPVTITHTDGCGMISPEIFDRNTMVRMPFVKGLLTKFDFKEFIRQFNGSPIIKDIYGKEHDIFKENIQVIFTKSQFKMWKYFDSWDQYKENFKKYHCECGFCNTERDIIPRANVNYQMLQSLTDFTEDDINYLVAHSNKTLENISKDKNTMLRVFGVTDNSNITDYYQEALSLYPELLKDEYSKAKLRGIKNSLVRQFKAGKLEINGKFFFLIPDMFAACQHWFCGEENPEGLLANGEVYSREYSSVSKVDLLRSPHLYREHAVRKMKNTVLTEKYFDTKGVYTSCHDLISKILMFDNDGDISLVIADQRFVGLAERNVKRDDIVPLYYIMKKAPAQIVNQEIKNEGICKAFSTCKIGIYSNFISKIWNQVDWKNISEDERQRNLNLIKYLCLESNFSIDSAKTNYMCVRPADIDKQIKEAIHYKVPHYFIYAKGRTEKQVEPNTSSLVNQLESKIINPRLSYKATNLGNFNYKYLMNIEDIKIDQRIIDKYADIGWKFHWRLNMRKDESGPTNLNAVVLNIRREFQEVDPNLSLSDISDMLVEYLYGVKKNVSKKEMLWQVFGEFMVNNLKTKIPKNTKQCPICGARFVPTTPSQKYCFDCSKINK